MLSQELEETLKRAMGLAAKKGHEYATLEHLLFALTEDNDALEVLSACNADIDDLRQNLMLHMNNRLRRYRMNALKHAQLTVFSEFCNAP